MRTLPRLLAAIGMIAAATAVPVRAGGPLAATGTTHHKYPAGAFPLSYKYDQGTLGAFSNNTAKSIADYAFAQWDNVSTAALSFTNAGQLPRNVGSNTDAFISGFDQFADGVNPVIFDNDGSITDSRLGVGAKNSVYGFAASAWLGTIFSEGYVVINGALSEAGEDIYKAVITHEVGHFLGVAHSQVAMRSVLVTMYPAVESPAQRTLRPEDRSAISLLYPIASYPSSVGSISGTVKAPNGAIMSGVNVTAVDSATGEAYSSVVDYYSGGGGTFDSPPAATGSYTIGGLPPGTYYVRIDPIVSLFSGGSSVASYSNPINTTIAREWYNGTLESGDMLLDNTNEATAVTVTANLTTSGINFITNESSTLRSISYHTNLFATIFALPISTVNGYATRITAPTNGSLLGMKFDLISSSVMPTTGELTVSVYTNTTGSLAGIPGSLIGSVTVPFKFLAVNQTNEIWLREIGPGINFSSGEDFHIVMTTNGVGTLEMPGDDGAVTQNRTSYRIGAGAGTWRNYPQGGFEAGFNLMMTAVYTTATAGVPQPAATVNPTSVDFGRKRPGQSVDKTVILSNPGTAPLDVTGVSITGPNRGEFSIVAGGGSFTLARGQTRQITLRFAPQDAAGVKSATLSVASNAPTTPTGVPLSGAGVQTIASATMERIEFGSHRTGAPVTIDTVIIQNTGNDTLHIAALRLIGADSAAYTLLSGKGPAVVLPNATYKARLRFTPRERRDYAATLVVEHDAANGSTSFALTGTGIAPAIEAREDTLAFGGVRIGQSANSTGYFVRNSGNAPLNISAIQLSGIDAARFELLAPTTFPATLQPGQELPVEVRFTPTQRRAYTATLLVGSDAEQGTRSFVITGRGSGSVLSVPAIFSLGRTGVGKTATRTLRMKNTGDEPLSITALEITGTNASEFTLVDPPVTPGSPVTVLPDDSVAVTIRFLTGSTGTRTATLSITHNGESSSTDVTLQAVGAEGVIATSTTFLDFGEVTVGAAAELAVIVRNSGSGTVVINSRQIATGDFALVDPAGTDVPLAAGDSLTLRVRFAPGSGGAHSSRLEIRTDSPNDALVTVDLTGTGRVVSSIDRESITTGGARITLLPVVPNPARDAVEIGYRIEGSFHGPVSIRIVDLFGRTVSAPIETMASGSGERRSRVDLGGLPSGDYRIVLRGGAQVVSSKLIVTK